MGVIEANKNWAVSTIYIGNVFIQAGNDEKILMLLCSKVAERMVCVNPTWYRPYITDLKKGVPMVYVRLSEALYGRGSSPHFATFLYPDSLLYFLRDGSSK